MNPGKSYYPALTGIRALAMYMVYVQHFPPFPTEALGGYAIRLVNEFYVAVIMFFVLSGFLIAERYYDRPERSFREYLIYRVARVYPMYFLLTTAVFLIGPVAMIHVSRDVDMWAVYLANITFLRGFFQDLMLTGIAPGWTLSPEECFYFTAPLAFILIKRSWTSLIWIPLGLLLLGYLLVNLFGGGAFHGFMESNRFMRMHTFFGLAGSFFSGVAIAMLHKRYKDRTEAHHFTIIGGTLTLGYIGVAAAVKDDHMAVYHPLGHAIVVTVLSFIGIGLLLWGLTTERTWLSMLLGNRFVGWVGDSSLTFYLLHLPLVPFLAKLTPSHLSQCLITTALALILNRTIERPADRLIKRWGRQVRTPRVPRQGTAGSPRS